MSDGGPQYEGRAGPPPPLTYLAFLVLGLVVNLFYPLSFSSSGTIVPLIFGLGIITGGGAVAAFALQAMKKAGVSPLPWKPPGRLVVDGPFRFSRNPIYISFTLLNLGISVAVNTLWPLALLIFALVVVDRGVIRQEERYLEKRFGEEYRNYKSRVRRWI